MLGTRTQREMVALTPAGRAKLEQELHELRAERLPRFVAQLAELCQDGVIQEESLILLALQDEYLRAQRHMAEIERLLALSVDVEPAGEGVAALGSRVTIEEDGERETVQLVSPCEANAIEGRITADSPVGQTLLGHGVGDTLVVAAPCGERLVRIVALS